MKQDLARVLVLFGPTASGKTALALAWAERLGGEIVNADSRQVYARIPVITACPSAAEYGRVVHHMFEFLEPSERFSAGAWAVRAREVLAEIISRGKVPIVVGGTGFYLRALMEGMDAVPEVGAAVEREFEEMESEERFALLRRVDPDLARSLHVRDTQRVVRGLAVWRGTGRALSEWQNGNVEREAVNGEFEFVRLALCPERAVVRERIGARWEQMVAAGAVDEVRALRAAGFTPDMPGMSGVGVREIWAHLEGEQTLAEAGRVVVDKTRQYAKRQVTWLRNSYGAEVVFGSVEEGEKWNGASLR